MYSVKLQNCNNIRLGKICIEENKLNIKYGINRTGKTTLSRAIELSKDTEKLQVLKSYFSENSAEVDVTPGLSNVLFFNEDFVDQVVFKEDEVIENSFEVFLKTPTYDQKKEQLDKRLQALKEILTYDSEILAFRELLEKNMLSFQEVQKVFLLGREHIKAFFRRKICIIFRMNCNLIKNFSRIRI